VDLNQKDLEHLLTNLVIEKQTRKGWIPTPEEREALIRAVEIALLDKDSLRLILAHLQTLPGVGAEPSEPLTDMELDAIMADGLEALYKRSRDRFFLKVVDPFALLSLRDEILDALPPYWWESIRSRTAQPPRTGAEIWAAAVAAAKADRGLAVAGLDSPQGPRRWVETARSDQIVRVAPADAPAPAVKVEFTLTQQSTHWQLDVDVLTPPPLRASRCTGRLLSASGVELGRVEDAADRLTFALPTLDVLADSKLDCDYRRSESDHIRFNLPVTVP